MRATRAPSSRRVIPTRPCAAAHFSVVRVAPRNSLAPAAWILFLAILRPAHRARPFACSRPLPRCRETPLLPQPKDRIMAGQATVQNQRTMIKNQKTILKNQATMLANQRAILANQRKILGNQIKLLKK
jgi:hypothetical protein